MLANLKQLFAVQLSKDNAVIFFLFIFTKYVYELISIWYSKCENLLYFLNQILKIQFIIREITLLWIYTTATAVYDNVNQIDSLHKIFKILNYHQLTALCSTRIWLYLPQKSLRDYEDPITLRMAKAPWSVIESNTNNHVYFYQSL